MKSDIDFISNNITPSYFLRGQSFSPFLMGQACCTPCRELLSLPKQRTPLCMNCLLRLTTHSCSLCTTGSLSNSGKTHTHTHTEYWTLDTVKVQYSFSFQLCFGFYQLLREMCGSLPSKFSAMFTS